MIGIFSKTIDSNFIEAAGYSDLDFIIIDQEHGSASLEIIHNHIRAAKLSGIKSIVRVPNNSPNSIGSVLDAGAEGVQVPNISNYEEAYESVKSARFHPDGMRGVCKFVRAADYGLKDKNLYFKEANTATLILQIEGVDGVKALDEILTIDGFDVVFVGPYDLSQSVGFPGMIDHPKVIKLIKEIVQKVKKSNKKLGTFADNIEIAKKLKNMGFNYIAYSVDVNLFSVKCNEVVKDLSDNE